jgi:hypothetical protein
MIMGYTVVMHIETVPNRGSHPTILLRQSYREGKKVRKRTLANLTALPSEAIEILRRALRGEKLVPCDEAFAIERSIPHGHVKAVLGTIRKLGLDTIIASKRSRQRDLVVAMIAERLLHGCSNMTALNDPKRTEPRALARAASRFPEVPGHIQDRAG